MNKINLLVIILLFFISCSNTEDKKENSSVIDSVSQNVIIKDTSDISVTIDSSAKHSDNDSIQVIKNKKQASDSLKAAKENEVKLQAYYFHPTARCSTCLNIESYSIEAIKDWEKNNKIKIRWSDLNIEDSLNEHFIDEYELKFSSLILVKYKGGKKQYWKNLEDTWQLVNDKPAFTKYVHNELDKFINEN